MKPPFFPASKPWCPGRAAQEDEVGDYKIFEVEVFRHGLCPAVVHVYHVCRVGPRFGRTQVLTSSSGWSHSICDEDVLPRLLNSRHLLRSAMSLEIVREELSGESKLVPRFALKGALPDALLEQYEFWRGERRLVGKLQRRTGDAPLTPSCLVVHLSERCHVQRLTLDLSRKDPEKQLDELMFAKSSNVVQGETLVDLLHAKQTSSTYQVAQWLLHLDDLSHVLAWSSAQVLNGELMDLEKEPPLTVVELPRLGLSFTADSADAAGGLRCDQHGGLKVVGHRNFHNQKSLERLLKPFPHFVLLEDDFGELFLLSSLAQRPRQTAAEGLQWQRGDESWLSKLRQEQRHQLYRIFTEFLIAPSLLAELHLMLLRVAQGMFSDACSGVMACIASGLPQQPEESLLWDEITSILRGDARLGAAVLRLKLVLQLHRQGQGIPEGWNPEADFLAWANYGWDSVEGQLLTLEEEAALLDLLGASSEEANWELRARSTVHRSVLQISAGSQGDSDGGGLGLKVQLQRSKDLGMPGPLERGKLVLDNVPMEPLSLMLESPPNVEGPSHALFLEQDEPGDLKRGVLAVSSLLRCLPLRLSRDFLLLYELLNRSRTVWLLPSDDPALTAELLVRLVPSEELQQRPALAALLRLMESPSIAERLPKFRSPIETWIPSLLSSLKEFVQEMQDLKHGPSESPGPLPSAFWTFAMNYNDGQVGHLDKFPVEKSNLFYLSCHTLDSSDFGKARICRALTDKWLNNEMTFAGLKFDSAVPEVSEQELKQIPGYEAVLHSADKLQFEVLVRRGASFIINPDEERKWSSLATTSDQFEQLKNNHQCRFKDALASVVKVGPSSSAVATPAAAPQAQPSVEDDDEGDQSQQQDGTKPRQFESMEELKGSTKIIHEVASDIPGVKILITENGQVILLPDTPRQLSKGQQLGGFGSGQYVPSASGVQGLALAYESGDKTKVQIEESSIRRDATATPVLTLYQLLVLVERTFKVTAHKISYTEVERAADDSGRDTFKVKLTKSMVFKFLDDDRDGGGEAPAKRAKKNVTGKSVFRYSLDALAKSEFIQSVFRYRFEKIGQTLKLMKPYVVLCQNIKLDAKKPLEVAAK